MSAFIMFPCNSSVFRDGEMIFLTKRFYPPDLLEAWKKKIIWKTQQVVEWRYVNGSHAELWTIGDVDTILDEFRYGKLDLKTFAEPFINTLRPRS